MTFLIKKYIIYVNQYLKIKRQKKKKILVFIGSVAIVGAVVFNVSLNSRANSLSDLTRANIKALAQNDVESGVNTENPGGCGWLGATQIPCLTDWAGNCGGDCTSFFSTSCARSARYSWCNE